MDDIEVWLRTDLVRLDFSLSRVGRSKAEAFLRPGLGTPEGAAPQGGGGGGRPGQAQLLLPPRPHSWPSPSTPVACEASGEEALSWASASSSWLQNTLTFFCYFSISADVFVLGFFFFFFLVEYFVCLFLVFISFNCDVYTEMNWVFVFWFLVGFFFFLIHCHLPLQYLLVSWI